jgi:hypothetical protein
MLVPERPLGEAVKLAPQRQPQPPRGGKNRKAAGLCAKPYAIVQSPCSDPGCVGLLRHQGKTRIQDQVATVVIVDGFN